MMDHLSFLEDQQFLPELDTIDWDTSDFAPTVWNGFEAPPGQHPPALHVPQFSASVQPASDPTRKQRVRSSLACASCRSRHSKCDAQKPSCSRCLTLGNVCSYATSRRGRYRLGETAPVVLPPVVHAVDVGERPVSDSARMEAIASTSTPDCFPTRGQTFQHPSPETDNCLDLYYANFHRAHPFLLPRHELKKHLDESPTSMQQVYVMMQYVASFYSSTTQRNVALREQAENVLQVAQQETGFTVQALLIFAIVLHANDEFVRARDILDRAIAVALRLRMSANTFLAENSDGCKVTEESWRRTYWCLYATDGIFSAIRHASYFAMYNVPTDMQLPCEESSYQIGQIPAPRTVKEYDNREFLSGEHATFSSFAYLIDLAQILGFVLAIDETAKDPLQPEVVDAEARLRSWMLYLPETKRRLASSNEIETDEILFQAHVVYHTLKTRLHRPFSVLSYSAAEQLSTCAPPPSQKVVDSGEEQIFDFHTTKVLEAAQAGIGIFALPSRFTFSPVLMCGLNICLLAQLAACRLMLKDAAYSSARGRVRFGLSVLNAYGSIWPLGRSTWEETKVIALEMLALGSEVNSRRNEGFTASDNARSATALSVLDHSS